MVSKNPTCTKVVMNSLDFFLFPDSFQNRSLKPRLSLHKYEPVVVLTGGACESGNKSDTQCFVPSTSVIMGIPSHDAIPMCCFNPKQNKWSTLGRAAKVKHSSVICFHEELYVIGGKGSWQDVQIYHPILDKWRQGASMHQSVLPIVQLCCKNLFMYLLVMMALFVKTAQSVTIH